MSTERVLVGALAGAFGLGAAVKLAAPQRWAEATPWVSAPNAAAVRVLGAGELSCAAVLVAGLRGTVGRRAVTVAAGSLAIGQLVSVAGCLRSGAPSAAAGDGLLLALAVAVLGGAE